MITIITPDEGIGPGSGVIAGGAEATNVAGLNLREGSNVALRPKALTSRHLYNLRNQTWAVPRAPFDGNDVATDTLKQFYDQAQVFPSNADETTPYIYPKTDSENSRYIDRFNTDDSISNVDGNGFAAMGYFIIDALDRGASRVSAFNQLYAQYPVLQYRLADLPVDSTQGGATVIAQYAGRIFYSGFPGETVGADSSSPKLSSYVLFSQLVTDVNSIAACYQANDPTSRDQSDLLDTDGGFLRIEGAFGINGLVNLGSVLVVLAENGVWTVSGGDQGGFTATNYKVTKITSSGCTSQGSIVVVEDSVMYWSRDGIYNLGRNKLGDYVSENITKKTIQTYYDNIGQVENASCEGIYDSYEKKVKWLHNNRLDGSGKAVEICLDVNLGAFYKHTIANMNDTYRYPLVVKGLLTDPFTFVSGIDDVVIGADQVTVDGDQVYVKTSVVQNSTKEVQYLVLLGDTPYVKFSFGSYKDITHYDWVSIDGTGVDAKSFLLTGVISGGDFQRNKQIMSLTCHFTKTEDGFTDDGTGSGDWSLRNPSSCFLQTQFNWTNSANSNKWSRKVQAYRLRRPYFPNGASDGYDNGYYVTETKNRVRGAGKVMSILFESEPGKHLELLGWSMTVAVNGNV